MSSRFIDISFTGDKRLQKKLNRLASAPRSKVMRNASKKALVPVQQLAINRAPEGETGRLKKFIKVAGFRGRWAVGAVVQTGTRKQMLQEGEGYYPASIEYGFHHVNSGRDIPARPFLRSAMADRRSQAIGIFTAELKKLIRAIS